MPQTKGDIMDLDLIKDNLLEEAEIPLEDSDKYTVEATRIDSHGYGYYLMHFKLKSRKEESLSFQQSKL